MPRSASLARLFALGLLFSVATSMAMTSSASAEERRFGRLQQEAQALAGLSRSALSGYFTARRQLERQSSDQRLAQLRSLKDCLQRSRQRSGAGHCLEQARQQRERERGQWMAEMASLRQRYQLPALADRPLQGRPGGNHWR
jgi:hypothetical protein